MSDIIIQAENISKKYTLGSIGSGSLYKDIELYWARIRGKDNPHAKVNEEGKFMESIHWALRDVSFEINRGDTIGIIGSNGAGKSTLLKIMSRVTSPTTGSIKIRGRVASLLEVGTGFHLEMTGRENIFLNGAILGLSKLEIKQRLDEIVDFAGVGSYIDTPVKRYSSGMYVRLAFAVAAHLDPEILIVDEVLAVGDADFQKKCLGKMKEVSKNDGKTILFVSHQLNAVSSFCTKGILLDKGKIAMFDNVQTVIANYYKQKKVILNSDIGLRTDRQGNGPIRLVGYSLLDISGQAPIDQINSGQDFTIALIIDVKKSVSIIRMSLGIDNLYDQRLTLFDNNMTGEHLSMESTGIKQVHINIRKFPLIAGDYSITFFVTCGGIISDWIINAFEIKVNNENYFNNGQSFPPQQGITYIDHSFQIIDDKKKY